ncbi:MAG: OB-fold domain-containing protein [Betaproteobacteria bacterium]|nr:OB-fold domain-containing protein [Betaproteobacteria bacterium]
MEIKPGPRINAINRPFWEGCNEERMVIQHCASASCAKWFYFPRVCCPYCGSGEWSWQQASGIGRVVSYTRVHRPNHKAFFAEAPYYFAAIELAEGPLMYGRLEAAAADKKLMNRPVKAFFIEQAPGQKLPFFAPID